MRSKWLIGLLGVLLCAVAFLGGVYWRGSLEVRQNADPCSTGSPPQSYGVLTSLLREFDDAATLAINLPRELVVDQVGALQAIRRQAEVLSVPNCITEVKGRMVDYMNRIVDLLVAFVGGVSPDLVLHGLESSGDLRDAMEIEMANVTGATVTPYPTLFQFPLPVSGTSQDQPEATSAPTETAVIAIVTNDQGANLRAESNADAAFIAALPPDTQVEVLGASTDRLWVYVKVQDGVTGWLYVPLITLNIPIEEIQLVE